jgi:PST family polysaccharide transporter
LLVLLISPIAAAIYQAPRLIGLLAVLASSMPIAALASVPGIVVRARMQFGVFAVYGSLETLGQALMTVGLAWCGFGVYSFVIPVPIFAALRATVWWRISGATPNFQLQYKRWKYLVGNTATNFASKTIVSIISQGDYVVLGLIATQDVVGVYYLDFDSPHNHCGCLLETLAAYYIPF